jgi:hypothetical protein
MNPLTTYDLELQASDQRERMHNTVTELKSQVRYTLDPSHLARKYAWAALGLVGLCAITLGYSVAGIFTQE